MTKDEALRLALDWFKCYQDKSMSRNNAEELADEVIVAIKAALEAEVEPVAYLPPTASPENACYNPSQRMWVGLTRTELIRCGVLPFGLSYELYESIEAKLKEKNT